MNQKEVEVSHSVISQGRKITDRVVINNMGTYTYLDLGRRRGSGNALRAFVAVHQKVWCSGCGTCKDISSLLVEAAKIASGCGAREGE